MKKTIRVLSVIIAVMLMLTSFPVCNIFASAVESKQGDTENGLKIDVKPGKSSYASSDTAEIKVTVKNNYGFDIDKLMIAVYSGDCKLPAGEKCKSDVKKLKDSEETVFTVRAKLGSGAKLSFFQKILFFFRNLFSRNDSFEQVTDSDRAAVSVNKDQNSVFQNEEHLKISFAGAECSFDIYVIYDCGFSGGEKTIVSEVNEEIINSLSGISFDETKDPVETVKENIEEELGSLGTESITFSEEEGIVWYNYNLENGETAIGGVKISQENDDDYNNSADLSPQAAFETSTGEAPLLMLDGFGRSSYQSIWDEYSKYYKTENKMAKYENCRNLSGRMFLCFSCHGNVYFNTPFIALSDYPFDNDLFQADLKGENAASIIEVVIEYVGNKAAIKAAKQYAVLFPAFFSSKKLDNTVVFLECCYAFGTDDKNSEALADNLLKAGALAVIGFQNAVNSKYSTEFMKTFISKFTQGSTVEESVTYCENNVTKPETDRSVVCCSIKEGKENSTILNCAPKGRELAGLQIHYIDDTAGGNNGEGDFVILINKSDLENKKTKEEKADVIKSVIEEQYGLWAAASVTSLSEINDKGFYNVTVHVSD